MMAGFEWETWSNWIWFLKMNGRTGNIQDASALIRDPRSCLTSLTHGGRLKVLMTMFELTSDFQNFTLKVEPRRPKEMEEGNGVQAFPLYSFYTNLPITVTRSLSSNLIIYRSSRDYQILHPCFRPHVLKARLPGAPWTSGVLGRAASLNMQLPR